MAVSPLKKESLAVMDTEIVVGETDSQRGRETNRDR